MIRFRRPFALAFSICSSLNETKTRTYFLLAIATNFTGGTARRFRKTKQRRTVPDSSGRANRRERAKLPESLGALAALRTAETLQPAQLRQVFPGCLPRGKPGLEFQPIPRVVLHCPQALHVGTT